MMWSLFLGNLSSHVRHQDLENAFRRFGRSKLELKDGFGFVIYDEHRDAERALKALKGRSICGENPSISWAKKHRPFQRLSRKPNFYRRGSWEKYESHGKSSFEAERGSDGDRRENHFLDETKDVARTSNAVVGVDEEWKDQRTTFDDETKDVDPLDTGRWDPHSEGSPPDHIIIDDNGEDEIDTLDEKEDDRGSMWERPRSPPEDRHHQRPSQGQHYERDRYKRGHDGAMGKTLEKCYNCGEYGHVKWQCRSRPRVNARDGYDPRRNGMRYFRGAGPFRGVGRFRGIDGPRRMFNRDVEGNFRRNNLPRHDTMVGRRNHNLNNGKPHEDSKRGRHQSKSPEVSSSRERSKKRHKRSNKKSLQLTRKRRNLSSDSQAHSGSPKASSSSLQSKSHSQSGLKSHSKSVSGSSRSNTETSSSVSLSKLSHSKSSRSRSRSSSSPIRSRSVSSHSQKSDKNRSQSPTESRQASHSSHSHNSLSVALEAMKDNSPSHLTKQGSPFRYKEDREGILFNKDDQLFSDDDKCDQMYESPETEQEYLTNRDRRQQGSKETDNQKLQNESESDRQFAVQSNGAEENAIETLQTGTGSSLADLQYNAHAYQDLDLKCRLYMKEVHNHERSQELSVSNYSAARLWPWEAILSRRLERGLISIENYQRRLAQNYEFGIKDKFVRSSSGWWEKPLQ